MRKEYKIKGLDCANCAAKLETRLNKIEDYDEVIVNFMSQKLIVESSKDIDEVKLKKDIENINMVVSIEEVNKHHHHEEECSCGHEHHHHHEEECTCGHDHHEHKHEEECSCGHEHHHEHSEHHLDQNTRVFLLDGIDCANCAAKVESRVGKLDGVNEVSMNFIQKKLYLKSNREDLLEEIQKICNGVESGMIVSELNKADTQVFLIEGLDCANCAAKVEAVIGNMDGVQEASLNFIQKKLYIRSDKKFSSDEIQEVARRVEGNVEVFKEKEVKEEKKKTNYLPLIVFAICLICAASTKDIVQVLFYYLAYLVVGYKVLKTALNNMMHGQLFDENFLMAIATIGALIIKEYPEAIAVMVFYQIGEYFQGKAVDSSRRSISELMDIHPDFARVNGVEVNPEEVLVGQIIEIRPGERVPMDCIVTKGESTMDTFSITGESVGRRVSVGSELVSGFVNKQGSLEAKVTCKYSESAVSRILEMVENATNRKAKTERFITKFAKIYTPIVVGIGFILALVVPTIFHLDYATWIYRGMIFLVVSCPCALVLSVPLGYFAGIGAGSKQGVLIKGSNYLEALEKVDTIVCDKTGTLTKGNFKVVEVNAVDENMMDLVALAESHSHHPIALSILESYQKPLDTTRMTTNMELAGMGIHAIIDGDDIYVGNSRLMDHQQIPYVEVDSYGSVVYVAKNNQYLGHIVVADEVKPETKETINTLKSMGMKVVMLTGDLKDTALKVAKECGITDVKYELLPDQKVEVVESLGEHTAFIGDGINDAPVLARSSVGISMGGLGSDAAIEASDIVLMDDQLDKVVSAIRLAKYTKKIIMQNIIFSLGIKILVMILSIMGKSSMWLGVFADVGVAIIAVMNSLRILRHKS